MLRTCYFYLQSPLNFPAEDISKVFDQEVITMKIRYEHKMNILKNKISTIKLCLKRLGFTPRSDKEGGDAETRTAVDVCVPVGDNCSVAWARNSSRRDGLPAQGGLACTKSVAGQVSKISLKGKRVVRTVPPPLPLFMGGPPPKGLMPQGPTQCMIGMIFSLTGALVLKKNAESREKIALDKLAAMGTARIEVIEKSKELSDLREKFTEFQRTMDVQLMNAHAKLIEKDKEMHNLECRYAEAMYRGLIGESPADEAQKELAEKNMKISELECMYAEAIDKGVVETKREKNMKISQLEHRYTEAISKGMIEASRADDAQKELAEKNMKISELEHMYTEAVNKSAIDEEAIAELRHRAEIAEQKLAKLQNSILRENLRHEVVVKMEPQY